MVLVLLISYAIRVLEYFEIEWGFDRSGYRMCLLCVVSRVRRARAIRDGEDGSTGSKG